MTDNFRRDLRPCAGTRDSEPRTWNALALSGGGVWCQRWQGGRLPNEGCEVAESYDRRLFTLADLLLPEDDADFELLRRICNKVAEYRKVVDPRLSYGLLDGFCENSFDVGVKVHPLVRLVWNIEIEQKYVKPFSTR